MPGVGVVLELKTALAVRNGDDVRTEGLNDMRRDEHRRPRRLRRAAPGVLLVLAAAGWWLVQTPGEAQFNRRGAGRRFPAASDEQSEERRYAVPLDLLYSPLSSLSRNLSFSLKRDNIVQTMAIIEAILSSPEDSFADPQLAAGREDVPSLKKLAREYIEQLPEEAFEPYRRRWEVEAEVLLASARETGDLQGYLEVVDRYYYTNAGFESTDWLATRSLDLGRPISAARMWNELIDSRVHRSRVTPNLLFKAAIANRLAGDGERASALMQQLQETAAGRKLSDRLQTYLASAEPSGPDVDTGALAPGKPASRWTYSLTGVLSDFEQSVLKDWRRGQWADTLQPLSMPRSVIKTGPYVSAAGYNRLLMFDAETGALRAEFPLKTRLREIAEESLEYQLTGRRRRIDFYWDSPRYFRRARQFELHEKFVWNTINGRLTTDGRSVFLIEGDDSWSERSPGSVGERTRARFGNRGRNRNRGPDPIPVNRLIALPIPEGRARSADSIRTLKPRWVAGDGATDGEDLDGAYFLAPPVAIDGTLYSVVEQEYALHLVALDPASGKVQWKQGIANPGMPLFEDANRRFRSCEVRAAGGLLIVTTQVGVVVALDPVRRNLQWVYYVGDFDPNQNVAAGTQLSQFSLGYLGFPDVPLVAGRQLFLLPRQSGYLHCIDLTSGHRLWKTKRYRPAGSSEPGVGDEFLACATDDTVVVVGDYRTRGLSRADGRERWHVDHERISGQGVLAGDRYLLPLESSELLAVNVTSGTGTRIDPDGRGRKDAAPSHSGGVAQDIALKDLTPAPPAFGHLIEFDGRVVSLGLDEVRSFPLPDAELHYLLSKSNPTAAEQFRVALLSPEGLSAASMEALQSLANDPAARRLQQRARETLVQRYLSELKTARSRAEEDEIVRRLRAVVQTDSERMPLLIHETVRQMEDADVPGLLASLSELQRVDTDELFPVPGDEPWLVSPGVWMRLIYEWAADSLPAEGRRQLANFLQSEINRAVGSGDADTMSRLLHHFPGMRELDVVRLELGRLRRDERTVHESEMLLRSVLAGGDRALALQAREELAQTLLWAGHASEAAVLIDEAERRPQFRPTDEWRRAVAELRRDELFNAAMRQQRPYEGTLRQVLLESLPPGPEQQTLTKSYDDFQRYFRTPPSCRYDLMMKRAEEGTTQYVLAVVSRESGLEAVRYPMPDRVLPSSDEDSFVVGNFFPLGCQAQVRGYSLIPHPERRAAWTRSFLEPRLGRRPLVPGYADADVCTVRGEETLFALNSRDGRVLWRREGIPEYDNRQSAAHPGLFGDRTAVCCSDAGAGTYVSFDTFTGRALVPETAPAWLEVLGTAGHRLVGRETDVSRRGTASRVFVQDVSTGERTHVWECVQDGSRPSAHLNKKRLILVTPGEGTASPSRMLKVIYVPTQEELVSVPVDAAESDEIQSMQYFEDRDNHYVNIRRSVDHRIAVDPVQSPRQANFSSSSQTPSEEVQGVLIAVDKATGRRRWSRVLPACSVMQYPQYRFPFLITFSWMTERRGIQKRRLHMEVLSTETGDLLGETEDFVPRDQRTQMIQALYDPDAGLVEINGPSYRARIHFGGAVYRLPAEVPVF